MYHYLTGAASWYMLTFLTEAFGVRGKAGDLEIVPALMGEQFDAEGKAEVELPFAGRRLRIVIENPHKLQYGEYRIKSAMMEGGALSLKEEVNEDGQTAVRAVLERAVIERLSGEVHTIEVLLDA